MNVGLWWKANPKSLPAPSLAYATTMMVIFARLHIYKKIRITSKIYPVVPRATPP